MTLMPKDEELVKALAVYGATIKVRGWEAGEPLVAAYSERWMGFREMAWAIGCVLRAEEINRESKELVFTLDAEKSKKATEWLKDHPCENRGKPLKLAIGVGSTYIFTDTSIGRMETVECPWKHKLFLSDDL